MTTGTALAIAAGPTVAALLVLGLSDPKRRRIRGDGPAPMVLRRLALGVLACCVVLASTAGAATLLIFGAAATLSGWAVAAGLASLPGRASSASDAWLVGGAAVLGRGLRRPALSDDRAMATTDAARALARRQVLACLARSRPRSLATAAMLLGLLVCAIASLMTWRSASLGAAAAQRLVALQALALSRQTEAEVRSALPCLDALVSSLNAEQALEDVLAGHATSLAFPTPSPADGGDVSLQTCLLAYGEDSLEVEATQRPSVHRFVLDAAAVRAVKDAVVTVLTRYDELVAAAVPAPNPIAARLPPTVSTLLALMNRNLHRAETRRAADRFPDLLRWTELR